MATEWDFGFSAVSEEELEQLTKQAVEEGVKTVETQLRGEIEHAERTLQWYQEKMGVVEKMMITFIDNLAANPEKAYIYWPQRALKLKAFKEALLDEFHGN